MKTKKVKYTVEERVHNIEELIWSLFISIGLVGIIIFYKSPFLWVNIILISILAIIFGNFSVRFFILTYITGQYWENATTNFLEQKKEKVMVWIKWMSILSAIIISKFLMKYNWQTTAGILILTVAGNILTNSIFKPIKKKK